MKNYEKPMALMNDELAEGVYAASGDQGIDNGEDNDNDNGPKCNSIYVNGVFHPSNWSNPNGTMIDVRGCEGCPANNGHCRIATGEVNWEGDFRPSWEVQGHLPTDPCQ